MALDHLPRGTNSFYINPVSGYHEPAPGVVFVFGTNLRGRHGAGAALTASLRYGYPEGQAEGFYGDAYGIPTKDARIKTLPLHLIAPAISRFVQFTHDQTNCHPGLTFFVTPIGTGLAGYSHKQIAPLFQGVTNCHLPAEWRFVFK